MLRLRHATTTQKSRLAPLVLQTWLRSSYEGGAHRGDETLAEYCAMMHDVLAAVLHVCDLWVAELEGVDDEALGWCCKSASGVLHYVYVKSPYRRRGIAARLIGDEPGLMSCWTHWVDKLGLRRKGWRYCPHALWRVE